MFDQRFILSLSVAAVVSIVAHAAVVTSAVSWLALDGAASGGSRPQADESKTEEKENRPTPPPATQAQEEEIEVGSAKPLAKSSVAWISYEDFQTLIAPKGPVEQPAVQQEVDTPIQSLDMQTASGAPSTPGAPAADQPEPEAPEAVPEVASGLPTPDPMTAPPALPPAPPAPTPSPTQPPLATTLPPIGEVQDLPDPDALGLMALATPEPSAQEVPRSAQPEPQSPAPTPTSLSTQAQPSPRTTPPADVAHPAPTPAQPAPTPGSQQAPGQVAAAPPRSDKDSQPVSLSPSPFRTRLGSVLTGEGIEIKPARPRFSVVTLSSGIPSNPRARLVFNATGKVINVHMLKSTGYLDFDAPLEASLYKWKASGPKLAQLNRPFSIEVDIILIEELH